MLQPGTLDCSRKSYIISFIEKFVLLERLKMSVRGSTTVFLNALSQVQNLRELDLLDSNFSNLLDLAFVANLPSLEKLDLSYCKLTSACLNTLSGIETHKSLRVLNLSYNDFSGSLDLAFVTKFSSLKKLWLYYTHLTPELKSKISEHMKEITCI